MPEDPLLFRDRFEAAAKAAGRLGYAENDDSALALGEMEQREHLLLHLWAQVDQDVAAGYQVEARERRIAQQTLGREHHRFAQLARHPEALIVPREEALQARRRNVLADRFRI